MDILKVFVIIAFIVVTVCTLKLHPDMHQPMIIEDADFKLTRISDTIATRNIPVTASIQKPKTTEKIVQPAQNIQNIRKEIEIQKEQPVQQQTRYVETKEIKPVKREKTLKQTAPDTSQIELLQQLIKEAEKEVQLPPQPQPQPQPQTQPKQQSSNLKNPYMTEQEEIIAWNKWRSNINNQIMRDSNVGSAPLGTVFYFTFVVDKYGNISNIKVECSNPYYMDLVRNNLKPAILNLQKQPILNFPKGTQRTSTVVLGFFLVGVEDHYSTPDDYSDYERITY